MVSKTGLTCVTDNMSCDLLVFRSTQDTEGNTGVANLCRRFGRFIVVVRVNQHISRRGECDLNTSTSLRWLDILGLPIDEPSTGNGITVARHSFGAVKDRLHVCLRITSEQLDSTSVPEAAGYTQN